MSGPRPQTIKKLPGSWEDRVSDALRFKGEIPPQPKRKRAKKVKKK